MIHESGICDWKIVKVIYFAPVDHDSRQIFMPVRIKRNVRDDGGIQFVWCALKAPRKHHRRAGRNHSKCDNIVYHSLSLRKKTRKKVILRSVQARFKIDYFITL